MELRHFFIFLLGSLGIPLFAGLCLLSKKFRKKEVVSLESGVQSFIRKTNRHKNNYFTISMLFSFLTAGFSLLLVIKEHIHFGKENWPYYLMGCWVILVIFVSYLIARVSGGIKLDD